MQTIRTTLDLRKIEARRLKRRGYEIEYIETRHLDSGEESTIVWIRPTKSGEIPECEIPY
jgi:hypothetical protein